MRYDAPAAVAAFAAAYNPVAPRAPSVDDTEVPATAFGADEAALLDRIRPVALARFIVPVCPSTDLCAAGALPFRASEGNDLLRFRLE